MQQGLLERISLSLSIVRGCFESASAFVRIYVSVYVLVSRKKKKEKKNNRPAGERESARC